METKSHRLKILFPFLILLLFSMYLPGHLSSSVFAQAPTPFLFGSDTGGFFIKDLGGDVKFRIDQSGFLQAPLKYPPSGDNLVQNGSFESKVDSSASNIADGWTQNYQTSCANCSYSLNTSSGNFKSGKQSAALTINALGGTSSIASVDTPIEAGKDYKASIDIKCSVSTSTVISIIYFSGTIGGTTYADRSGTSETVFNGACGTSWSTKELTFTARSNCSDTGGGTTGALDCTRARMLITTTTASSTLYGDNAKITNPSANTQLTASNISSGSFGANTGGGAYSFPAGVTVANGLTVSAGTIGLPDNSIASADVNFNYAGSVSKAGAATTATALAANGGNCAAGSFPLGVDASGAIESCTTVSSLAPGLTGSGASGTWGINVTGSAGSVTWGNVSGKPTSITRIADLTGSYGSINIAGTTGGYAGINFSDEGLILMMDGAGATGVYTGAAWKWYFDTNGALTAGTVPVGRITGLANSATITASSTTVASQIVLRDVNGDFNGRYINSNYFNSTDDVSTGTITYLMGKFGDNYYRSATAAKVVSFLTGADGAGSGLDADLLDGLSSASLYLASNPSGYISAASTLTGLVQSTASGNSYFTGGNVGIGTSVPAALLEIKPSAGATDGYGLRLDNGAGGTTWELKAGSPAVSNNYFTIKNITAGTTPFTMTDTGVVGIGTSAPSGKLNVSGGNIEVNSGNLADNDLAGGGTTGASINNNGAVIRTSSDIRLKTNIKPVKNALAQLLQLKGVNFNWINQDEYGDALETGFVAQEVEKVLPQVVKKSADARQLRSLNTEGILAITVEALKEQQTLITNQQQQIDTLTKEMKLLKGNQ